MNISVTLCTLSRALLVNRYTFVARWTFFFVSYTKVKCGVNKTFIEKYKIFILQHSSCRDTSRSVTFESERLREETQKKFDFHLLIDYRRKKTEKFFIFLISFRSHKCNETHRSFNQEISFTIKKLPFE